MQPGWSFTAAAASPGGGPLARWLLATPQLMIASALRSLRQVLVLISLLTLLFTERIPPAAVRHDRHDVPA
jgi:hypothetical protein